MHVNVRKTHKRSFLRTTIHVRATSTFCGSASSQARRADVESPRRRVSRPLPARARKFDYARSYALLQSYYRVRAQHAEVFHQLTRRPASSTCGTTVWRRCCQNPANPGRSIVYFRIKRGGQRFTRCVTSLSKPSII